MEKRKPGLKPMPTLQLDALCNYRFFIRAALGRPRTARVLCGGLANGQNGYTLPSMYTTPRVRRAVGGILDWAAAGEAQRKIMFVYYLYKKYIFFFFFYINKIIYKGGGGE
jgi:hypothetical protein